MASKPKTNAATPEHPRAAAKLKIPKKIIEAAIDAYESAPGMLQYSSMKAALETVANSLAAYVIFDIQAKALKLDNFSLAENAKILMNAIDAD